MTTRLANEPGQGRAFFHAFIETTGTVLGALDVRELEERQRILAELADRFQAQSPASFNPSRTASNVAKGAATPPA